LDEGRSFVIPCYTIQRRFSELQSFRLYLPHGLILVPHGRGLLQKLLREFEHFKLCFSLTFLSEAQARRGEEPEIDPEQFQDPDNEYGLFAGTTYEQDDEGADRVYEGVDHLDSRRSCVLMVSLTLSF